MEDKSWVHRNTRLRLPALSPMARCCPSGWNWMERTPRDMSATTLASPGSHVTHWRRTDVLIHRISLQYNVHVHYVPASLYYCLINVIICKLNLYPSFLQTPGFSYRFVGWYFDPPPQKLSISNLLGPPEASRRVPQFPEEHTTSRH